MIPKAPGARMPKAQTIAEATLAIWNAVCGMAQMPPTSGTTARNGPKKRPKKIPSTPQRSKNA
ncbi:hypothetical protein D3C87_1935160 [compost metagenome]